MLVVDDEPASVRALAKLLRASLEGVEVEAAGSGEEALAAVRERAFDVVVVDVILPGMGGPELVRRMRTEGSVRPLAHVVIVTGLAAGDAEALARDCGATAWMTKPVDAEALAGRVRSLLRARAP